MRIKRVAVANKILAYYGLKLQDWNGSKYVLSDKKGVSNVVNSLGDMWQTASKMCHRTLDPLDPAFLQTLEKAHG